MAIKANGDYKGYPMSTSIAHPLIAAKAVEVKKLVWNRFVHSTGKGNDQFRIEFGIRTLMGESTIHVRFETQYDLFWEIEYAIANKIPIQQSLKKFGVSMKIFGVALSKVGV